MKRTTTIVLILCAVLILVFTSQASTNDPLITLSYFKEQIDTLKFSLKRDTKSELKAEIQAEIKAEILKEIKAQPETDNSRAMPKFEVMSFKKDDTIIFAEGAEFVLRAGIATVIDHSQNGIADLTSGETINNEEAISKNHLMLVPKNDGRGMLAKGDIWVMIKGDFKLIKEQTEDNKPAATEDKSAVKASDKPQ